MNLIVNDLHVRGLDEGKGPVYLWLHGWGNDHTSLLELSKSVKGRHILPDLPGFGGTNPPAKAWGVTEYALFIADLLKKLSINELEGVIGHSFGVRIILEGLGNGLFGAKKSVLLGAHGLSEPLNFKSRVVRAAATVAKPLPGSVKNKVADRFRSADYRQAEGIMKEVFLNVIAQDATECAGKIGIPALLVYGQDDQTTPPELGRRMHQLIPNSRLELVPNAGHYVHLDQPERVKKLITEWLK